jgi:hypothetical protein
MPRELGLALAGGGFPDLDLLAGIGIHESRCRPRKPNEYLIDVLAASPDQ